METNYMTLENGTLILYDKYSEKLENGLYRTTMEGYKGKTKFKLVFEEENQFLSVNRAVILEKHGLLSLDGSIASVGLDKL